MTRVVSPAPVTPLPRPSNPTPLELAIHRFEMQARVYHHNKIALAGMDPDKRGAAEQALKRDWDHLQRERIRISTQAELQQGLAEYRASASSKSVAELVKEPHHPTTVLARNLTAVAEPKPSADHDPHHIIMGAGRFQGREMTKARLTLHLHKIGINDPINGVWLPRKLSDKGHWATPNAPAHKEIHRYNYETWIWRLFGVAPNLTRNQVVDRLRDVKRKLKHGGYPSNIVSPKDTQWAGE